MSDKNFTIYKSSAGSGKTFTLVKEYLALALNDESNPPKAYRHILAVTFTNKAASEMKERIIKALKELSQDDYTKLSGGTKTLLAELKKHKKLNFRQQVDDTIIRKRANNVLTEVLHNYSDFAIGTIDSFVHKIVRTFAFDLKIPMSFELEMDDDKLLTQAIDLLIAQIGTDETLTKALVEFTESKTDDEKSWHIENDLKYFAKNLLTEDGAVHIEKLRQLSVSDFFKIKDTIQEEIKKFEAFINGCGKEALKIISDAGIEHEKFAGGANGIGKYFTYLAESRFDKLTPSATIQKNIDSDSWYAGKASVSDKAGIDAIKGTLTKLYNEAFAYIQHNLQEVTLFRLINTTIYSLAVLNEIEKLLNEYKAQNNILHISEFNKLIAKIVLNEPIPFIYERLGERYNNYLIDEFQDTSVLQFQNLLPLIDNSLASGHFTMLVGDGKQAIYRWRGGEVEQFAMLPEVFAHNNNPLVLEREQALKRNHNPQVLDKNYRSKREIIEFNNAIFRTLSNKLNEKFKSIYETLEQGFNPENSGGFVQVEFLDAEKEEMREQNLERTYLIIQDLLIQNFQLRDVAILVRKNTDGSEIANYLSNKGIEVISSDSLLLSNSAEVNFIYSLLRYLNNTSDQIIQAELLEYLVASKRVENTDINQLLVENKQDFISVIKLVCRDFNSNALSKMALYELCEELVRLFKLNTIPNAYIQFYLDEVLNYSIKQNNNLNDFIDYWEDKKEKASLIVPLGMNAVTIMTIHRAKGLEFPAVILPFSNGKVEKGKKHLWVDLENNKIPQLQSALVSASESLRETPYGDQYDDEKNKSLLDSLNVLYVALTRPEERLYILTGKPSKSPGNLSTVSDMFAHYYQQNGDWQEGKTVYTFGEQTTHKQHLKGAETQNFKLLTFNSNQWRNHIKMRAAAPSIWNLEITESKKDYGVMVHTALAKIKSVEDIESAVNSMFLEGLVTADEKENLLTVIKKIIKLPKLKAHFAQGLKVKNESEIISLTGEKFRLDRVVFHPVLKGKEGQSTAVIIDYKTGEEKPDHKKQILQYADLLNQMGYSVTEKLLVYIEEQKVLEC
ncbi:MAG: UvrD-helicase domain-containing protein [Bacteroidia bacterium]|nr:UvrD-helicase domain-containing protein [Bacteroidia bacterium]